MAIIVAISFWNARIPIDVTWGGVFAGTMEAHMPSPRTKIGTVRKMLSRPAGASIAQIQKTTGWQPHSIRAALTRLRQKGHAIERSNDNGRTKYHIDSESASWSRCGRRVEAEKSGAGPAGAGDLTGDG